MKYEATAEIFRAVESRSREGAWIEISCAAAAAWRKPCRSREGAWIEIAATGLYGTSGSGRSREGAWIEIASYNAQLSNVAVAPVRERGLKSWQ